MAQLATNHLYRLSKICLICAKKTLKVGTVVRVLCIRRRDGKVVTNLTLREAGARGGRGETKNVSFWFYLLGGVCVCVCVCALPHLFYCEQLLCAKARRREEGRERWWWREKGWIKTPRWSSAVERGGGNIARGGGTCESGQKPAVGPGWAVPGLIAYPLIGCCVL